MAKVNLGRVVGKSAYEIWQEEGNVGSEQDFLNSLKGQDGTNGINGQNGTNGQDGKSAYQIWLDNGNTGTEQNFLDSLKGQNGTNGNDGVSPSVSVTENQNGAIISVTDGNGTTTAQIRNGSNGQNGANGSNGQDGKSAYQIWLDQGNEGTEQDFLDSLKGEEADTQAIEDEILELRQENQRLRNDLNATTLSVSATGENIQLNNTAKARFKQFRITGNSKQTTRQGYNLLENTATSQTVRGVDITINDDKSITCNGTATGNILFRINSSFNLERNTDYIISSGAIMGDRNYLSLRTIDGETIASISNPTERNINTGERTEFYIAVYITSGNVVNNLTLYPMIVKAEDFESAPPYEEYGVMPSNEYPSEIKNVTGNVVVKIQDENNTENQTITFPLSQGQKLCRRNTTQYDYLGDNGIVNVLDQIDNTGTKTIEQSFSVKQIPLITPYTSEQQAVYNQIKNIIQSYNGQTNIYSTNETSPVFDVEAYKDINSVINDLDSRLSLLE